MEQLLDTLYLSPSKNSAFTSREKLFNHARLSDQSITRKDIDRYLSKQDAHTLHKVTRKRFDRRKVLAPKPNVIASADLADMRKLGKQNSGFIYLLIFIDVFSRFLDIIPLKKKDGTSVMNALKILLSSPNFSNISRIFVDKGGEFYNTKVKSFCEERGIIIYSTHSYEIKATIAERVIQTIKRKLYKYMTAYNTKKYIDILPDIVNSYNNSPHSSLGQGQTPRMVHSMKSEEEISNQFYRMYKKGVPRKKSFISSLTVGDTVRISDKQKTAVFTRGFYPQNTEEIFKIRKIDKSQHPIGFYLKDLAEENIEGIFYKEELVPTFLPEVFPIDILKKKTIRGKTKYFVNFRGYPSKFNTWVDATALNPIE